MIDTLGNVSKLIPLFSIIAYGIGFTSFVIYFIKIKALGKINFFTYMQLSDHVTMFGIGVFLSVVFFILLIPAWFIYEYILKKESVLYKKILIGIAIYFVMNMLISAIDTIESYVELVKMTGILFCINFFVAYLGTFEDSNKQPMGYLIMPIIVFFISAQLFFIGPDDLIRMSGYGNHWACLSLSSPERRVTQINPNIKVIKSDEKGYAYTSQKVFILLRLRDHVFFRKGSEKAEDIDVLPSSEIRIYNLTSISEGICGRL